LFVDSLLRLRCVVGWTHPRRCFPSGLVGSVA
jgi:hypothetical protein